MIDITTSSDKNYLVLVDKFKIHSYMVVWGTFFFFQYLNDDVEANIKWKVYSECFLSD